MSIGKVYQKWSRDMVHLLLSEIRHLWPKFRNKKYTMKMLYEDASTKLCEYGYEVSAYRVEKKWHNLASTYRNVLNKMHNYGEESITRRHEYFEAMHELMGNMNAVRQKSSVSPLEEMLPGTSQTRSSSPLSPASTLASPPSSPEPSRKRIRTDEHSSPKIILIPAVQNHDQVYPQQSVPIQTQVKGHIKQQIIDDAEEQESRREWREWKRQQELINVQREGNRVLENIDNNLVAIRKSLDFIVQKLSNQG